jgi:RNA polymerase sigma-70 factor (ECF subfamily)
MEDADATLVSRAQQGEGTAFRELVVAWSPKIFRLAYRITGDEATAEDAVQETFLRLHRALPRYDARARFGTWLYRVALNATLDIMRKQKRGAQLVEPAGSAAEQAATDPSPERLALSREVEQAVQAAMGRLTPLERAAFVLRHFEGRSIAELCALLRLSENAGKQAVFRAVKKLRSVLAPLVGAEVR